MSFAGRLMAAGGSGAGGGFIGGELAHAPWGAIVGFLVGLLIGFYAFRNPPSGSRV